MEDHHSLEQWAREADIRLAKSRQRRKKKQRWDWIGPVIATVLAFLFIAALALAVIVWLNGGIR